MKITDLQYSFMLHTAGLYSDKFYIKRQFKHYLHYSPNLTNPRTFQEKLQWLKLYDRKPVYSVMVDKYEAKDFIQKKIGAEYIIPTIGIYNHSSEIDYDLLPEQFVMKTTHDSGTVVVCKDKSKLDIDKTNRYLDKRLRRKYYLIEREWPYKNVKPRIIVEKLIGQPGEDLCDYKFFCFDGQPKLMFIVSNRWGEGGHKADFFDMEGNPVKVYQPGYENTLVPPQLPSCFEKMKELASTLSEGVPHLRVDFYYTNNQIYVGELTFSDSGGYVPFVPDDYNYILGDYIHLSIK